MRVRSGIFVIWCVVGALISLAPVYAQSRSEAPLRIKADLSGEQVVFDDRNASCPLRQFPDAPPRALRDVSGRLFLFATFETNWYLTGTDWSELQPVCASAGSGRERANPEAFDDKYWIAALHTLDGKNLIALGSHEYLGARHTGKCRLSPTPAFPFPCWYGSITQYQSSNFPLYFVPAASEFVVARPRERFDPDHTARIGYFATSNIVTDDDYRYVFIFSDGMASPPRGNCLLRAPVSDAIPRWRAWNGTSFTADLSVPNVNVSGDTCKPISSLGPEVRGLVKHRISGQWVAVFPGRQGSDTGIFFATSPDLFQWSTPSMLLPSAMTRVEPACPNVYRYPSIIDHAAPAFSFETMGASAYLYSVKILLENCRLVGRQIVRIPITIH